MAECVNHLGRETGPFLQRSWPCGSVVRIICDTLSGGWVAFWGAQQQLTVATQGNCSDTIIIIIIDWDLM